MPKLHSSREIIKILKRHGFVFVSQKGSHTKYSCIKTRAVVIVPANKKEIPAGTFSSILRQSKLLKKDFD